MESALSYYFNFHYETMGSVDRCVVHDPLAMILSEDPTIGDYKLIRARVEHDSTEYRGMIKTDNRLCLYMIMMKFYIVLKLMQTML